ncbi:MAG: hypothetical protein MJE12_16715, partial [Alphaproteobacteria bacterium]|nr:hypothetical protein [Alphaproteobacteria bacterium]
TALIVFVMTLSQTGQLAEILIPKFHQIRHEYDRREAYKFFNCCLNLLLLIVITTSTIIWFLAEYIVELRVPGFDSESIELGVLFFRIILPLVAVQIVSTLLTTLAHAEGFFGPPESTGLIANLVTLASILTLVDRVGIWSLIWALWLGQSVRLAVLIVYLYAKGYRYTLQLRSEATSVLAIFHNVFKTIPYVLTTQVYGFALDAAISTLPQGTYAVFKYVTRLLARGQSLLLRPIAIVFFTQFSDAYSRGLENLKELAREALARSLLITVPAMAVVAVASKPIIISLLGQRGFTDTQITLASELLIVLVALMFASGYQQVGRKMTMSLGMVGRQYYSNAAVQVVCFMLVWPLVETYGIPGAVAMFILNNVALSLTPLILLRWYRPELSVVYSWDRVWRWTIVIAIATGASYLAWRALGFEQAALNRPEALLSTAGLAAICLAMLGLSAWLLRIKEVRATTNAAARLFQGKLTARSGK